MALTTGLGSLCSRKMGYAELLIRNIYICGNV
jgi:hypothetical protein